MKLVNIYTDGSCSPNPGPGGWCAILLSGGKKKVVTGSEPSTTNNRMELMAAIAGLRALAPDKFRPEAHKVTLYSDSQYVIRGVTTWSSSWNKESGTKPNGSHVKNWDLWTQLLDEQSRVKAEFVWVRGHDGNRANEEADRLAVAAREAALGNQGL